MFFNKSNNRLNNLYQSPLIYYIFYSFFAFLLPIIFSNSPIYKYLSTNVLEVQQQIWISYFVGFFITSLILSFSFNLYRSFRIQIFLIIYYISFPLRLIINNNNFNNENKKFIFKKIFFRILLLVTSLFIIQSFFAFIHHSNNVVTQGLAGRFYPNPLQIMIFYLGNFGSILLSFSKKIIVRNLAIFALCLGCIGQALDLSRYAFLSIFLILITLLLNFNLKPILFFKKLLKGKLSLKNLFFLVIVVFALFLIGFKFLDRMPLFAIISYLTSYSFYNIGSNSALKLCEPNIIEFIINLSGLPIFIANNVLNLDVSNLRLDPYRPLPGFDYLNCIFKSPFLVGSVFSILLFPIFTLLSKCSRLSIKYFVLILLIFSSISFYQYNFRMTLRVLQLSLLFLTYNFNVDVINNQRLFFSKK